MNYQDLSRLEGLHVAALDHEEYKLFSMAVKTGRARRAYPTFAHWLTGVASVQLTNPLVGLTRPSDHPTNQPRKSEWKIET